MIRHIIVEETFQNYDQLDNHPIGATLNAKPTGPLGLEKSSPTRLAGGNVRPVTTPKCAIGTTRETENNTQRNRSGDF